LRYAPYLAIVLVVGLVIVLFRGGDDGGGSKPAPRGSGPVVFSQADKDSVQWGPSCDTARGTLAIPTRYAPPCVAPYDPKKGNGGATAPGVTGDTITIALYQAQPDILEQTFFQQSGSDESLQSELQTVQQYVSFFEAHYETYGRHVKIVPVKASGAPDDEEAARADAIKVATEVKAFASWGGPAQTSVYAEELSARGIMCLGDCMLAAPDQFAQKNAPHLWLTLPSTTQAAQHWAQFISKQLAGRDAEFAGDESFKSRKRVFGLVRFDEDFAGLNQTGREFVQQLKARGVHLAADVPYELDLSHAQEAARTYISKLKAAKVTSVIFAGDPITPSSLTTEATAQHYFPEWVLLGAAYTDTSLFGRTYDQQQWQHAFGVSELYVPVEETADDLYNILVWQSGQGPRAKTWKVLVQAPLIFYTGLHLAGPHLTPETFRDGLFRYPSGPTSPTRLHVSWGHHGIWKATDWFGSDDTTVIWWNPNASGIDEVGNEGKGMWEYADGGRRYLPNQWPSKAIALFDPKSSVTTYDRLPASDQPPSYPSPAAKGASK
jgi:hypothetical protein